MISKCLKNKLPKGKRVYFSSQNIPMTNITTNNFKMLKINLPYFLSIKSKHCNRAFLQVCNYRSFHSSNSNQKDIENQQEKQSKDSKPMPSKAEYKSMESSSQTSLVFVVALGIIFIHFALTTVINPYQYTYQINIYHRTSSTSAISYKQGNSE